MKHVKIAEFDLNAGVSDEEEEAEEALEAKEPLKAEEAHETDEVGVGAVEEAKVEMKEEEVQSEV